MSSFYFIVLLVQLHYTVLLFPLFTVSSETLNVHCTLHYTSIVNVTKFLCTVNDELPIVILNVLFVQIKSLVVCTFMHILYMVM